ncbi:unnamed protein product [Eruca vesicaria subsp. sativa]|uniref:MADS-box domain-containing protein n=1 Tax=Eruca vesicaria subsp. sativa TaxID=29727 RepID=A0ABC8J6J7_ERUVS|nr:unnamed protein product [Eruca vesicaria subsp. sativa]
MVRSRVKLTLIADKTSRRTTFKKRKAGIMKKLNELVTLCGVKACAVVYSGENDENPEVWPSWRGADEVISKFLEFPKVEREKKMYNQPTYTYERIMKEQATLLRLQEENREFELKEIMFDLFRGKRLTRGHHYHDANDLQDLSKLLESYSSDLNKRIYMLQANGEQNSFPPLDVGVVDTAHPVVMDVNPIADADVADVTMPFGFSDHIQNMNMDMNQQAHAYHNDYIPYQNMNQQELVQHQIPTYYPNHVQYQNMNHQNQFQYQVPNNVYDQNQYGFYGLNQGMGLDFNHNLNESFNQYPNPQNQPFMNQWMEQPQQMNYAEELANVAPMDDNYYNYHQLPSTSYMPSMDLSALNTNNFPTRFGLE